MIPALGRWVVPAAAALAVASAAVFAQQIEIPDWENSVRFELVASQEPVRPGDEIEIAVVAEIDPGYHLYGPEEEPPSRTEVSLSGEHLEPGAPEFPPAVTRNLVGLGEYDLYEGRVAIRIPVAVSPWGPESGSLPVSVKVNYQVCTDLACSAPTSKTLSLKLRAAKPGTPVRKKHTDVFPSDGPS